MVKIKNLYFAYNNLPFVLDNISLTINKGDYVTIVGKNGSGKSTLVKLLLGLISNFDGEIIIDTDKIAYVPQRMDSLSSGFPITVEEVLRVQQRTLGVKDKNVVNHVLSLVGMCDFKNKLICDLSGGQAQKIFIARALIGNPELLILDEPSTGIDMKSQKEIYDLIKDFNLKYKMTVISVEHNVMATVNNSSHVFRLDHGHGKIIDAHDYVSTCMED